MVKNLKKIVSILCVLVMTVTVFSAAVTNVLADEEDGEETAIESLNPCVATNEYIHIVWQENLTGNMEIYFVNDMGTGNYENTLRNAIDDVQLLMEEDDDYEDVLEEVNEALEKCLEQDYKHSIDSVHDAVKELEKVENVELINVLVDSVRDFAKTNILYAEYYLTFNNSYIQEVYNKYYLAVDKYDESNYDAAIKQFKNSYLKIVEGYEENDGTFTGIDFGKIVRISYTNFDSVLPQIFLNGTISVGWKEITDNETHVYYARSSNNGVSWWYFDATEQAYTYLCYAGVNPDLLSSENKLLITKTLERILIIDGCHYFYVPIISDGFVIEDRRVYSPIDDPHLTLHEYKEPIYIGDKKIHIRCGPGPSPKAPDLTVTNISFSNNNPVEGETITVYATVKNIGDAFVSGVIADILRYDPSLTNLGNVTDIYLSPSESVQVSMEWAPQRGYYELRVIADPNNGLPEGLENNNDLMDRIIIAGIKKDNWIISAFESYTDKIILCNSLSVVSGHLSLTDTTLVINCSANGTAGISITNGATLTLTNTSVTSTKPNYYHYNFNVHGTLQMINSTASHTFGGVRLHPDSSTGTIIIGGSIVRGGSYGLYCDGVSITIRDVLIADNIYGIYSLGSSLSITRATITRNNIGIYAVSYSVLTLDNNFIRSTTSDIYLDATSTSSDVSVVSPGGYECGKARIWYVDGNRNVEVIDGAAGQSTQDFNYLTWGIWDADNTNRVTVKLYYQYDEGGWPWGDTDRNQWDFWISVFKTTDKHNQNLEFVESKTKTFTDTWGLPDDGHGHLEITVTADWKYQRFVIYMGARYWWTHWYETRPWEYKEDQDDYFAYIQSDAVIDPITCYDYSVWEHSTGSMSFSMTKGAGTTVIYSDNNEPWEESKWPYELTALELTATWLLPKLTSAYQYLAGEKTTFTLTVWVADVTSPSSYSYWGSTSYTAPLGVVDQSGTLAISGSVDGIQIFKCKLEVKYTGRNPLNVDTYDSAYSYVIVYPPGTTPPYS